MFVEEERKKKGILYKMKDRSMLFLLCNGIQTFAVNLLSKPSLWRDSNVII